MKKFFRYGLLIALIFGSITFGVYKFFERVDNALDFNGSIILKRYLSKDRSKEIVVFSIDGGATGSDGNYQIALVAPGEREPHKNGKRFFIGVPENNDVVIPEVEWETDESIRVYFSGLITLYKLELRVGKININYGARVNRNK